MKKKSTSQSAPACHSLGEGGFFSLRLLIGLFIVLAGVLMALLGFGAFSAHAQQNYSVTTSIEPLVPPGFDCSKIHELGIDKQDNMRAGAIMIACGVAEGGSAPAGGTTGSSTFSRLINNLLPAPLFIGGSDVNVILPDGTYPKVTQSESMEWGGPNNTWVVNYNDSRTSSGCYSGLSYSTDNGITWTGVQLNPGFIRDIQTTGDLQGSGRVYVATMNEGGGGLTTRQNVMYRSTDGGVTWTSTNAGPTFQGPGRATSGYFALAFSTIWRHMGWGQPAASGNVVSLDYAACGQNVVCSGATDHGDVYYIRSTDAGLTWGTPVKLNTNSGTAMQWQPSLTATQSGTIFASWYDQREVNGGADLNCTVGSSSQNCYRRWGRVSTDNGATWQADDMVGRALSPLPAQPDSAVQATYEGDYDYHSSFGTTAIGGWTDGRTIISGNSQQDVFVNFVPLIQATPTPTPTASPTPTATPGQITLTASG